MRMNKLGIADYLFLYSLLSIWVLLLYNAMLTFYGYKYYRKISNISSDRLDEIKNVGEFPFLSILIPAHNEEKVIEKTVLSILKLDYPIDKMELIVINDNSNDKTGEILERIKLNRKDRNIIIITTNKETGGKGKSNALNIGYKQSKGEFIVIYDADNTPEGMSLKHLVYTIMQNKNYAAVIGKFRTRNKERNLLTKFINIEGLSFQWMTQGGRWELFNLCTIPGTNFIIRRTILEDIGGWDVNAIAEDTEISIRIYRMRYKICFMPLAVTWEQEPENLRIWLKQRLRWVKGNIYVLIKYMSNPFSKKGKSIMIDIYYFFSVYFLFLSSVICSDVIFALGLFNLEKLHVQGNFVIVWILSYAMFILEVNIALTMERGENNFKNFLIVVLMYFTYCQLWIYICAKGIFVYTKDKLLGVKNTWYKTERF
jgi:cellulose synthase/poly-beta-1,6-N-acetylglucosamine synthase-like glycosyltransferase